MTGTLVEIIEGRIARYEIREQPSRRAIKFVIYRDGKRWRGEYASLTRAIEIAQEAD